MWISMHNIVQLHAFISLTVDPERFDFKRAHIQTHSPNKTTNFGNWTENKRQCSLMVQCPSNESNNFSIRSSNQGLRRAMFTVHSPRTGNRSSPAEPKRSKRTRLKWVASTSYPLNDSFIWLALNNISLWLWCIIYASIFLKKRGHSHVRTTRSGIERRNSDVQAIERHARKCVCARETEGGGVYSGGRG